MNILIGIVVMFALIPAVYGGNGVILTGGNEGQINTGSMQGLTTASPDGLNSQLTIEGTSFIKNFNHVESFSDLLGDTATSELHIKDATVAKQSFYEFSSGTEGDGVFAELQQTGDITDAESIKCSATATNAIGDKASVKLTVVGNAALSNYQNKAYADPNKVFAGQNKNTPNSGLPFTASGYSLALSQETKTPIGAIKWTWTGSSSPASFVGGSFVEADGLGNCALSFFRNSGTSGTFTWYDHYLPGKPIIAIYS